MITTQVRGGLGNQMFQYAAGRAAALRVGTELALDLRWFQDAPYHYLLDRFAIEASPAPTACLRGSPHPAATRVTALRFCLSSFAGRSRHVLIEPSHGHDPRLHPPADGAYLAGYWQSEPYFEDQADVIRRELQLSEEPSGANADVAAAVSATQSVSMHVRRGDYLTSPTHGMPTLDYYHTSMDLFREWFDQPHFFVFSDDPGWCREQWSGSDTTIVAHNGSGQEHEDLRLMSLCRGHVIANSSFSWWGAWLGEDGPVVAPARWFADPHRDATGIVPARWHRR